MYNLLSNAIKFQRVGLIKVYAELLFESPEDKYFMLQVKVKDKGVGMTSEE